MAAQTLPSRALSGGLAAEQPTDNRLSTAEVYEAHFQYVWRCLRSLGVRDELVDDALQDVFIVVQRKLPGFRGRAQLKTWLYAIAFRVARRYRAKMAKEARRFGESNPTGDLEHDLEHSERLSLARRALEALDDNKREVFVLACVESLSAPEIARIMSLPINTVYSKIRAARSAFSAEVAKLEVQTSRRIP